MNKYSILIVEDEALLAASLAVTLSSLGYTVHDPIATGEDAIRAAADQKPDLILMDIQLLGPMNGIKAAERIRAIADIPVIYLTAHTDNLHLSQAKLTEPYGFIVKPAQIRELKATIEMALYKHAFDRKLKESETRLQLALSGSETGMWALDIPSMTGTIDDRAARILGYQVTEIGSHKADWDALSHPQDRPLIHQRLADCLSGQTPFFESEHRMQTVSGAWIWVLGKGKITHWLPDGSPQRITGTMKDISRRKQTELDLVSTREKLDEAHHLAHIGTWDWDRESDVVTWSGELYAIAGRDPSLPAPAYKEQTHVYTPASWDLLTRAVTRALTTGETYNLELELVRPDDSIRWVNAFGGTVHDTYGKIIGLHGTVQDITERKLVELELIYAQESLEKAHHLAHIGTFDWVIETDTITWSEELFAIVGRVPTLPAPTYAELPQFYTQASWDILSNVVASSLKTDEPFNIELEMIHTDGSSRWTNAFGGVKHDPDGKVIGFHGTVQDITGHKRAVDALRESELLFREVFDNANDAVFLLERTPAGPGKYLLVNDKAVRMLGYSKEELLVMSPRDIVPEEIAKKVMPDVIKRLLRDGHATFESVHRRKDGSLYPIEVSTHTFLYQGRDVDLSIVRDISERKRAEEALLESEKMLRDIIEKNPMSIQIVDTDGFTLKVNHAHTILFGAVPPPDFSIFVDLQNKYPALEKLIRLVKSGEVVSLPDLYFNVHDSCPEFPDVPVWVRTIIFPLNDKSGKPERFIFMHENITGRRQAEEALRESEEKYRALFAAESDAIFVIDKETGIIIDCNDAIIPMYGYRKDEAIGQLNTVMSAEPDATRAATKELKGLIPIRYHKRKDGSIFAVEITANVVSVKGRDVIVAAVRDITERMRVEEALQQSEEKHRLLLDNSHDVIYTLDKEGLFTFVSTGWTRLLGHPVNDVVGRPFQQFVHPDDIARCLKSIQNVYMTGQPQTGIEYRVQHADGSWRWHTTNAVPIRDETGTIIGGEGSASDITERKLAENALVLASRKLTLLSGITRHDINNQLAVLQGYLSILKKKQQDPSLSGYFEKTSIAAQHIAAMIQFAREYEKIGVKAPVWQDCHTLVDDAVKEAPLGHIVVKNDLPAGTEVFADSLIIRVCYNLMDNAVRYGGKITTIRFSAEKHDGVLIIICEDDGVGVVAEEKEKIFEQGFGKNTGLGLALAHEILAITGITIRETGEPGKGARFEMTVPKSMWRIEE